MREKEKEKERAMNEELSIRSLILLRMEDGFTAFLLLRSRHL